MTDQAERSQSIGSCQEWLGLPVSRQPFTRFALPQDRWTCPIPRLVRRQHPWGWAFPDLSLRAEQHRRLWGLFVEGAIRYPWVWLTPADKATSVWIPPNGTQLSHEQEAAMEPAIVEMLGADAAPVIEAFELFDRAHPREVPHFYLSLLATRVEHRGQGYGLGLLAGNLRRIDDAGIRAYLEAINPANVAMYEGHGFEVRGSFKLAGDGPEVFTMWRNAASLG